MYIIRYAMVGGGYKIPFDEMSADVSEEVMNMLQSGWVLFRDMLGNYLLYHVDKKYLNYQLDEYEDYVQKVCKKYQIPYFSISPLSVAKYFSNPFIQKVIDNILLKGYSSEIGVDRISLGFTMNGSKTFCLVEVDGGGVGKCPK